MWLFSPSLFDMFLMVAGFGRENGVRVPGAPDLEKKDLMEVWMRFFGIRMICW